jgi:hypothetical protein
VADVNDPTSFGVSIAPAAQCMAMNASGVVTVQSAERCLTAGLVRTAAVVLGLVRGGALVSSPVFTWFSASRAPCPVPLPFLPAPLFMRSSPSRPQQVPPATVRPCNRFTCPASVATWAVGSWGRCNAVQDPQHPCIIPVGTQQRRVTCQLTDGTLMPEGLCSSTSAASPSLQPCSLPKSPLCACQGDHDCTSAHTMCNTTSAQCVCATGWSGEACSVPPHVECEDGVFDVAGVCCEGYIDAVSGLCCPQGASVDAMGRCCPRGVVDACGVCNGTGVAVGNDGVCCTSPLPPSGMCCEGGRQVDSCGVCGGDNHCR